MEQLRREHKRLYEIVLNISEKKKYNTQQRIGIRVLVVTNRWSKAEFQLMHITRFPNLITYSKNVYRIFRFIKVLIVCSL